MNINNYTFKLVRLFVTAIFGLSSLAAMADNEQSRPLNEVEIKAKYQNCPDGYYSGPRPGKTRYAKDNYLWVVSPEFAQRYCMPPEFVDKELKGAEAVAFRLAPGGFGEQCGWGGQKEVCSQGQELRFEIYIKRDVKLPIIKDINYFQRMQPGSSQLVTMHEATVIRKRGQISERVGAGPRHETFGLLGIKNGIVEWPIVALYQQQYIADVLDGIDLIAVQGSTGFFTNARMEKQGIDDFVIEIGQLGDKKNRDGRKLSEFAHVIYLPRAFTNRVRYTDKTKGTDWEALGKRALQVK